MNIEQFMTLRFKYAIIFLEADKTCEYSKFIAWCHHILYKRAPTCTHVAILFPGDYIFDAELGGNKFSSVSENTIKRIQHIFLSDKIAEFQPLYRKITWCGMFLWIFRKGFNCVGLVQHVIGYPPVWMTPDEFYLYLKSQDSTYLTEHPILCYNNEYDVSGHDGDEDFAF